MNVTIKEAFELSMYTKDSNHKARCKAAIRLIDLATSHGIDLSSVRPVATDTYNVGDICEVLLKGLKCYYLERKTNVKRSLENQRDDTLFNLPIEYKYQANAKYQATYTPSTNVKKRYVGIRYNNKLDTFEVLYFGRKQASTVVDSKSKKLNMKNIIDERDTLATVNELALNSYLEWLDEVFA